MTAIWRIPMKGRVLAGVLLLSIVAAAVAWAAFRRVSNGPAYDAHGQSARGTFRLSPDLRIGSIDSAGPALFAEIAAVLADRIGRIYVLDYQSQEIRVFSSSGAFVRRIGGRGQGPGEFTGAAGMNFDPQGHLWVWDAAEGRFSVFDVNGDLLAIHRRSVNGVVFPWRGEFTPDGQLVDWDLEYGGDRSTPRSASFLPILLDSTGGRSRTYPPLSVDFQFSSDGLTRLPFSRSLSLYLDRSATIWFAHTDEYTIWRRTLDGDTLLHFSRVVAKAPVTEVDRDSLRREFEGYAGGTRRYFDALREAPDTKPVIRRIFGDGVGRLYVVPEVEGIPPGAVVDAFSEGGVFLGRLRLSDPIALPLPAPYASADYLYAVGEDEFGVPYVNRFPLTGLAGAPGGGQ